MKSVDKDGNTGCRLVPVATGVEDILGRDVIVVDLTGMDGDVVIVVEA